MSRAGEFEWIARHFAPLSGAGAFSLKDDTALLSLPTNSDLVVTQDTILEGIHFLQTDPADLVARKAVRVNISDIVAKGAKPFSYSLSLGAPDRWQDDDVANFASGLAQDQSIFNITLSGGDTYRSPERLCVSITLLGISEKGSYKSRLGAKPGDVLTVSGTIGDAALGLKVAQGELDCGSATKDYFLDAYRLPKPPLAMAGLVAKFASASMDVSDGLLGDCRKLCSASSVRSEINLSSIPLSEPVRNLVEIEDKHLRTAITGGDDYQVLCAVPQSNLAAFHQAAEKVGVTVSSIGVIVDGDAGVVLLDTDGNAVSIADDSFSHF